MGAENFFALFLLPIVPVGGAIWSTTKPQRGVTYQPRASGPQGRAALGETDYKFEPCEGVT
jgi:hypothetical protein